jgi:hypothetical protein
LSKPEPTLYQVVQEKLDKLDKLDNFQKNARDVETIGFGVDLTTEFEKNSLLDELSNLSNFAQSVEPEQDAALDNLSNELSNLDEFTPVEVTTPASPVENTPEATEVEVMELSPQQSELPIYQRLDGNYEVQSSTLDKLDDSSVTTTGTAMVVSSAVGDDEWVLGAVVIVDATDLPASLASFDGHQGVVEEVKVSSCLVRFAGDEVMHIPFRGMRLVIE